jgi:hypothetical protein
VIAGRDSSAIFSGLDSHARKIFGAGAGCGTKEAIPEKIEMLQATRRHVFLKRCGNMSGSPLSKLVLESGIEVCARI